MILRQRVAHVHAFTAGQTAQELDPQSKAAAELVALYGWAVAQGGPDEQDG